MPVPVQKRRGRPRLSGETVEKVRVFLRAFEDNKKLISTSEIAKALQVTKNNHCDGCSHQELAGPEVPGPNNQLPSPPATMASAKPRSVTARLLVLVSDSVALAELRKTQVASLRELKSTIQGFADSLDAEYENGL